MKAAWARTTLIIWGFNDPSASPSPGINLLNKVASVLSRAEMHLFNQSGLYAFLEYPRETADLMISFIMNTQD